jgi:hypothetical protein
MSVMHDQRRVGALGLDDLTPAPLARGVAIGVNGDDGADPDIVKEHFREGEAGRDIEHIEKRRESRLLMDRVADRVSDCLTVRIVF